MRSVQRFWFWAGTQAQPLIYSTGDASNKDLGKRVGTSTAHVALGGVKRHVVDGLAELPAVGGEFLDACSALHVPQTDGTVVTCRHNIEVKGHPVRSKVTAPQIQVVIKFFDVLSALTS